MPTTLSVSDCERLIAGVYAGRAHWIADWGGEQFSLGRAWYTHLEQDRDDEYFREAKASDAIVERYLPMLQRTMRAIVSSLVGAPARARPGWCGPGVHVFPAGEWVSREGGVVHFDTEGLLPDQLEAGARALSLILMLQPPLSGGGLRVWDLTYEGEDEVDDQALDDADAETIDYEVGELVVIDSYRAHQIQPFEGSRDRISVTVHAVEYEPGRWETWF